MKTEKKNIKQIMLLILFAGLVLWISQNYKIFINLLKFVVVYGGYCYITYIGYKNVIDN